MVVLPCEIVLKRKLTYHRVRDSNANSSDYRYWNSDTPNYRVWYWP